MITKDKLKDYASKLMFDMEDSEYDTLVSEFEVIERQMDLIANIKGLEDVEPMTFPFITYEADFREDSDTEGNQLTREEVLLNSKSTLNNGVKVPKVVE